MTHPMLMIRAEIFCLILLMFIYIVSKRYKKAFKSSSFSILLSSAIIHIIFNIAASTVVFFTNFEDTSSVSYIVTIVIYVLFYLSVAVFSSEYLRYTLLLLKPENKKSTYIKSYIVAIIFIVSLPFLKIEFTEIQGTYISTGIAPIACSVVAFVDFIYSFIVMVLYRKRIKENVMDVLFPVSFAAIMLVVAQAFVSEILSTGMAITLVAISFFFSSENPTSIFQEKNKISAEQKFKTNSDFKTDIVALNEEFINNKLTKITVVRSTIDNLTEINSEFGHQFGDDCIDLFLNCAVSSLVYAENIYRTTGAEFTAIYKNKNEDFIKNDLVAFKTSLKINGSNLESKPVVSIGYAVSSETNNSVDEVLNAADYSLFKNREETRGASELTDVEGVSINITGLTNYMFDAMCIASNDNDHPFIMNLKTNVMRITPKWKEEFDLVSDIMYDLTTVWINHIHPDDRQAFIDDFTATVTRKQKTHNQKYRALNKDGVYIKCFCHGAVFTDETGLQLFAGHLETFGPVKDENDDSWVR